MSKVDPKFKCLELEVEPEDSFTPRYFIVKLIDKKDYQRYQKSFYTFNEAYEFYMERLGEKETLWLDVWVMEVNRRRINVEMYAAISGL
tara:strand:+ start:2674 stop:2940 length:267 start_codon:yes stop_codon:yes gene_type:complete